MIRFEKLTHAIWHCQYPVDAETIRENVNYQGNKERLQQEIDFRQ